MEKITTADLKAAYDWCELMISSIKNSSNDKTGIKSWSDIQHRIGIELTNRIDIIDSILPKI